MRTAKIHSVVVLITCLLSVGINAAELKSVALTSAGEELDAALIERIREFASANMDINIELIAHQDADAESLKAYGEEICGRLGEAYAFTVVIVDTDKGFEEHGVLLDDDSGAVVNATAMKAGADEEAYARRMERQVIRSIGFLLDLGHSPNPRSAMWDYKTMEQLDMLARNLDPPWAEKARKKARAMNIKPYDSGIMEKAAKDSEDS